jgi:hypothetical protein
VIADHVLQVSVGENVAVKDERRVLDQVVRGLERAGGTAGQFLVSVADDDAELRPVAEDVHDLSRLVGEAQDDFGDPCSLDPVDLKEEKRNVGQGHHRLRYVQGERTQVSTLPTGEYQCFYQRQSLRWKHI